MDRSWLHNPVLRIQLRALNLDHAIELDELTTPGETSLLLELTRLFQETAPPLIQAVKAALNENNLPKLYRAVHSLKSSAANIGALRLSQMCLDMEHNSGKESPAPLSVLKMNFLEMNLEYEMLMNEIRILQELAHNPPGILG